MSGIHELEFSSGSAPVQLNVHIGQVKVARNGETLKALLGSCVGVGLLWRDRGIYGLAHCLLPESPAKTFEIGGRFVDQAVASLLALMRVHADDIPHVVAVVAGGGNMTNPGAANPNDLVGSHNAAVAERELKKRGIVIADWDVGGEEGRTITINGQDGSHHVQRLPRILPG